MGAGRKYLSKQFKGRMFLFEYDEASEFYLSSCQKNQSAFPLLFIRIIVFLGCLGIVLSSIILTSRAINGKYWPIYLTHWGIVMNSVCAFFACWVSVAAYKQGSIDRVASLAPDNSDATPLRHGRQQLNNNSTFGLPWYVKAYWFSFNVAVPIAFFITAFYYAFLSVAEAEFAIDPVLDIFIHGMNSVLMLCLLLTAQHPSRMLHFYQPICVSLVYLAFGLIYYFAGGTDPSGNPWIYPNIDWRDPGPTVGMVVASAVMILIIHILVVFVSLARDWFSRRFIRNTRKMSFNY